MKKNVSTTLSVYHYMVTTIKVNSIGCPNNLLFLLIINIYWGFTIKKKVSFLVIAIFYNDEKTPLLKTSDLTIQNTYIKVEAKFFF